MRTNGLLAAVFMFGGATTLVAQQQLADPQRTPGVKASADSKRPAFLMENCKNGVTDFIPGPAAPAPHGSGAPAEYTVKAIPGVIEAGKRWRVLWTDSGENADGAIGVADGVFIAQSDKSQVLKIGLNGKVELVATDTYTGGALAMTKDGKLYVAERSLNRSIWQVLPERKLFADKKDGEPLECVTNYLLNDLVADSKGGIYMTMGGVYYANPQGVVMGRFGTVRGNGLILSKNEKMFYVTGRLMGAMPPTDLKVPEGAPTPTGGLVAYDVQPDGSLTNERQFAWGGGDGMAIDEAGRIYSPGDGGTWVIGTKGELLGFIPAPRTGTNGTISVAFGGPNKKTLFSVSINPVQIFAIDMQAEGIKSRPK